MHLFKRLIPYIFIFIIFIMAGMIKNKDDSTSSIIRDVYYPLLSKGDYIDNEITHLYLTISNSLNNMDVKVKYTVSKKLDSIVKELIRIEKDEKARQELTYVSNYFRAIRKELKTIQSITVNKSNSTISLQILNKHFNAIHETLVLIETKVHALIQKSFVDEKQIKFYASIFIGIMFIFMMATFIYLELSLSRLYRKSRDKDNQLLVQSRLAVMGEMISMIAHQWRQPLASITAAIATLKVKSLLGKDTAEGRDEVYNRVEKYVEGLSATIDDFRNFVNPSSTVEIFEFNEVINHAIEMVCGTKASSSCDIQVYKSDDLIIQTNKNELTHALVNIIKNSVDACSEKNEDNTPSIKIYLEKENNRFIIIIDDNAGGVSEEVIHRIFDPYFSTKGKNGTGLGLYMTKMLIEDRMKGELNANNIENGLRIRINIPC